MADAAISHSTPTRTAREVIQSTHVTQAANGVCYAALGETAVAAPDLERIVGAIPRSVAAALQHKAYYFVPLTAGEGDDIVIAERYDVGLSDRAVCHRNYNAGDSQCIFISTRLMDDKFSVAFELYINVGHAFVEKAGVSEAFSDLAWKHVNEKVRGESSLDAHEFRKLATGNGANAEKAKNDYFSAAFSDAIAIY